MSIYYDVADYGALADGVTDDTDAINAAIDDARITHGIVLLMRGTHRTTDINMTQTQGVSLQGAGIDATWVYPLPGTKNVIDGVGATGVMLRDFQLGFSGAVPVETAIFLGCPEGNTTGLDRIHLSNLYVSGRFSKTALAIYGVQSSDAVNCDFYNYHPNGGAVLDMMASNVADLSSIYTEIGDAPINVTNWTFVACEIHNFTGAGASGYPVRLDGTDSQVGELCFVGGNISSVGNGITNAAQYVLMRGAIDSMEISGVTLYSDAGPGVNYGFLADNGASVSNLSVHGSKISAGSALFTGHPGSSYHQLFYRGAVQPDNILGHGVSFVATGVDLDCDGKQVNMGATGVVQGDLRDPGVITAHPLSPYRVWGPSRGVCAITGGGPYALTGGQTGYYGGGRGSAVESDVLVVVTESLRLLNLHVFSAGSPGIGHTMVCTLMVNGSPQALSCVMTGGQQSASDTSHSVRVAAGDWISLRVTSSPGASSTGYISWAVSGQ